MPLRRTIQNGFFREGYALPNPPCWPAVSWESYTLPNPPAGQFKGGQNIRANVACTALEHPRARLWSPRFDRLSAGSPASLERGRG